MKTDHLTFTRFLAAIAIVVFHFGVNVFPFTISSLSIIFGHASLGVSYFFLLSGFVMTIAYGKRGTMIDFNSYIQNRAARILPLYYLALLLMLIYLFIRIKIFAQVSQYTPSIKDFFLNATLLQAWIPNNSRNMNTAAWTLSVEALFYVTFPLLYNKLYRKLNLTQVSILVAIVFVVSQLAVNILAFKYPDLKSYWEGFPLLHLNQFMLGNLTGLLFINIKWKPRSHLVPILLIVSLTIGTFFLPYQGVIENTGLYLILFIPLLWLLAHDSGFIAKFFSKKPMVYLGEISYGIYILQFPVYFFFTAALTVVHYKINQPLFYLYLILLIIVSAFSFNYIETPLRKIIKSR